MQFKSITKLAVIAGLFGAAFAAHADDSFYIVQLGGFSATGNTLDGTYGTFGAAYSSLNHLIEGATLHVVPVAAPTPVGVAASGTLVVGDSTGGTMTWSFTGTEYSGYGDSLSANMTLTGSTGDYSMYKSGTGDFSYSFSPSGGFSSGTVEGSVAAVPEPATYAVLGLGLIGLLLRKRS